MRFPTEDELDDALSDPPPGLADALARLPGDVLVLGVGGKMGPTLARMARRAAAGQRVIGVSRFTDPAARADLDRHGVETIACDLLDEAAVGRLPDAANVVYLAGRKFGSTGNETLTWAMNAYLPAVVARRFAGSRIVALSTGNVYGLAPVGRPSVETDPPRPVGEYAMSCLGRERLFEHFSRAQGTPVALIRLNYACDLRYGVLVDLARSVLAGEPVDLGMGHFNTIWQGDANAMVLRALARAASPPWVVNVTGPEVLSVRAAAEQLGRLLGRPVRFVGAEAETALVADAGRMVEAFGRPRVRADELIGWVAEWAAGGGRSLGKPTHFESRDGAF